MKKIAVIYSNRAEYGLLKPIIKRLKTSPDFKLKVLDLNTLGVFMDDRNLGELYDVCYAYFHVKKFDYIMCPFDRKEIMILSLVLYNLNIPIISLYSGDYSEGTHDDLYRPMISMMADIQFCASNKSTERTKNLLKLIGKSTKHCYNVGSTHLDDVEIDESAVPKDTEYELVLYHPPTRAPDTMARDLNLIWDYIRESERTILCNPNGDSGSHVIIKTFTEWANFNKHITFHPQGFSRMQFLGLLKNCTRFISNSSCLFFEAYSLIGKKRIVHVGLRNRGREYVKVESGASDRIVKILTGV